MRDGSVLGGPGGVRVGDIVRAIGGVRGWPPNVPIKANKLSELLTEGSSAERGALMALLNN